jgi:hypothetical protein
VHPSKSLEPLTTLQADFAVVDKQLDFSHLRDHLRRIAGGPGQLFSLGTDNAMLQLVSRGGPRVLVSQARASSAEPCHSALPRRRCQTCI